MSRASSDHAAHTDALGDADLTRLARQGDPAAFRTIMRRHNRRLFRVARSILRDDSEAEDMVQEAYVRAFSAMAGFRGEASLSTWLTQITLNEARGRLRKRRAQVGVDAIEAAQMKGGKLIMFPSSFGAGSPESDAARAQTRRMMEAA